MKRKFTAYLFPKGFIISLFFFVLFISSSLRAQHNCFKMNDRELAEAGPALCPDQFNGLLIRWGWGYLVGTDLSEVEITAPRINPVLPIFPVIVPIKIDPVIQLKEVNITAPHVDHGLPNKDKLPPDNTDDKQVGALCVFKTIEWVSLYLGNKVPSGESLMKYLKDKNLNLMDVVNKDGVPIENLEELISQYFDVKSVTEVKSSIDKGNTLMGSLVNGEDGHEIMITGYNDNGSIQYFDPELGKYDTRPSVNDFRYMYEIKGLKK